MKVLLSYFNTNMSLATLKEKGQITLPANIRKQIQADKGDIFNVQIKENQIILTLQKLVPADKSAQKMKTTGIDISKYIGSMKGTFGTTEEIDEYIRNERTSWD